MTEDALAFVQQLSARFGDDIESLLKAREARQAAIDRGELPDFLTGTKAIRDGDWRVCSSPPDLEDRRVEITGPTNRKMIINALNSGARTFMADCEDSLSPTWENVVQGQINLRDAVARVKWQAIRARSGAGDIDRAPPGLAPAREAPATRWGSCTRGAGGLRIVPVS